MIDTRHTIPSRRRRSVGFTLVELLVVVSIIAMLIAILLPSAAKARELAQGVACSSQTRQCMMGLTMFTNDHNSYVPPVGCSAAWPGSGGKGHWWYESRWMGPYLGGTNDVPPPVIRCPACTSLGIGYNHSEIGKWLDHGTPDPPEYSIRVGDAPHPAATLVYADAGVIANYAEPDPSLWFSNTTTGDLLFRTPSNNAFYSLPSRAFNRHGKAMSAGFLDGHAELTPISAIGFEYPVKNPRAVWDRF